MLLFFVFAAKMICSLHLLSSSLLSPQSLAPSQTQRLGMQRWLAHSNWAAEQNSSGDGWGKNIEGNYVCNVFLAAEKCGWAASEPLRRSWRADVPQWASSAPFSQSFSLSHVQLIGMQRPLGQAKKGVGHFVLLLPWRERRKKASQERIILDPLLFMEEKKKKILTKCQKLNWYTSTVHILAQHFLTGEWWPTFGSQLRGQFPFKR